MKRIYFYLFISMAMLMLSVSSAWAAYVKVTAENGMVSWIEITVSRIEIEGVINDNNIEIIGNGNWNAIDQNTRGSIDLNEVWSQRGGEGTHYQVKSIGFGAFCGCSGLTSVVIPSSVNGIGQYAFEGCSGLTSIEIPSSVFYIGEGAFFGCSLNKVIVRDLAAWCDISFEGDANPLIEAQHLYSDENTEITKLIIPNRVTSIERYAFEGCSGLTSIEIPSSVTSIGNGAFYGCSGLKKVIVKDIVAWCNISFEGSGANPLSFAHHLYSDENTEITNLIIPSSVTSIGQYAFYGCTHLSNLDINASTIDNNCFSGLSSLETISFGNNVKSIGSGAFSGCSGLKDITSEITEVFVTGIDAFKGCENATLHVPTGTYVAYSGRADWNRIVHIVEGSDGFKMTMACNTKGNVLVNDETNFTSKIGEVEVKEQVENTFVFTPKNNCKLEQVVLNGLDVTASIENNTLKAVIPAKSQMVVTFANESGDMNNDGIINISDVVLLVNMILGQ